MDQRNEIGQFTSEPRPHRVTSVSVICQVCKVQFLVKKYRTKKANTFCCSIACAIRLRLTGKKRPPFSEETKQKISDSLRERYKNIKPEDHPQWKGGKTSEREKLRKSFEYKQWRKRVFERDNYTCVHCDAKGVRLNADHILPWSLFPEDRFDVSNGRTLCEPCHKQTDSYLNNKFKERYMRQLFAKLLYKEMKNNDKIIVIVGDLGYKMYDDIRRDFPDRFYNVGAAEQAMMGIAVGLAMSGKIPLVYSITPFLLFRAAETIRNYINHENIPVKLIASGRDDDYKHDGFSHFAGDDKEFLLSNFKNIICKWPVDESELTGHVKEMFALNKPFYLNLKR